MHVLSSLLLVSGIQLARAHGAHSDGERVAGETIQQYAQRHMSTEHHIDSFDVGSFFQLHDLNRDGFWDREEIEAVYGVHHIYSQRKSKDDIEHQKKADHIVDTVLNLMDKNNDGKIDVNELRAVGLDGLPNFEDLGAEGHHYDVESEFFLHHEEEFHSTPETQTEESYTHPEDLEHFAHHESIELEEAMREAKYQGITVDEALEQHEPAPEGAPAHPAPEGDGAPSALPDDTFGGEHPADAPRFTRLPDPEKEDPIERFKKARAAGAGAAVDGQWGEGEGGYKPPRSPADRMKKNVPYKYKFRRAWGDF
ncbi:EF-hand domain-containing protein [Phanerochaete sordida]|uniref:EF-hand domain-containing protein n=1 Tax=Phanerochaete sordida TaxID=48140 RepID=A0A9P3G217_9APHY|nr:EF-hand domain-containing protein [Phanerochaete sordida]